MRYLPLFALCLAFVGCGPSDSRVQLSAEEQRLLAFLARDPRVIIEQTTRRDDGYVLVVTSQGSVQQRYLLQPDDPARPNLRLRRLQDACILLETVPNDFPGGGHGAVRY